MHPDRNQAIHAFFNPEPMKRYYFKPRAAMYAFDIWAHNEQDARKLIRKHLGVKTLRGVEVWQ